MPSACPLWLFFLIFQTVAGHVITLMTSHPLCLHPSPPLSTTHHHRTVFIHSCLQVCEPHCVVCLRSTDPTLEQNRIHALLLSF